MSGGSPFQISVAVYSQPTALSNVLKLQGLTVQLGPRNEDDETCDESDYHKTVNVFLHNQHHKVSPSKVLPYTNSAVINTFTIPSLEWSGQ